MFSLHELTVRAKISDGQASLTTDLKAEREIVCERSDHQHTIKGHSE